MNEIIASGLSISGVSFAGVHLGFIDGSYGNAMRSNMLKISWHFKTQLKYRIINFVLILDCLNISKQRLAFNKCETNGTGKPTSSMKNSITHSC